MSLLTLQKITPTQKDKAASAFDFILFNTIQRYNSSLSQSNQCFIFRKLIQFNNGSHCHQVYPCFVTEIDTYTLLYNLSGKKIHLTETIAVSCIIII